MRPSHLFLQHQENAFHLEKVDYELSFLQGLLGFSELTQFILTRFPRAAYKPLKLMISRQDPSLRLILLHASDLNDSLYTRHVEEEVRKEYGWRKEEIEIFSVITFRLKDQKLALTANLKAPIIIQRRRLEGLQHVLPSNAYALTYPLENLSRIINARRS